MRIGEAEGGVGQCFLFQILDHFLFFVPLFSPVSSCLTIEGGEKKRTDVGTGMYFTVLVPGTSV